jgi:hypothetical protein
MTFLRSPIAISLTLLTLAGATAEGQVGRSCNLFSPCSSGYSCQPLIQKCYNSPRQEGQPCSAGFSCGGGLRCQPGSQRCVKENAAPNALEDAGSSAQRAAQQAAWAAQQAAAATQQAAQQAADELRRAAQSQAAAQPVSVVDAGLVWTHCATEGGTCVVPGPRRVRFGAPSSYKGRITQSSVPCTNEAFFGDPMPGVLKTCSYWSNDPEMSSVTSTGSATNVARGKPTAQSSTEFDGAASRAVDGNTDGAYFSGSVTHTSSAPNQWWMVDLGASYRIESITIYNRTDCCAERLNALVAVTATPGWPSSSMSYQVTVGGQPVTNFRVADAGAIYGRFVYVLQSGGQPLSLTEVVVMGVPQ